MKWQQPFETNKHYHHAMTLISPSSTKTSATLSIQRVLNYPEQNYYVKAGWPKTPNCLDG